MSGRMDDGVEQRYDPFERLWLLRRFYPLRSDYDSRSTMSVDDAVQYAEELLRASRPRLGSRGRGQPYHTT